MSKPKVVAVQDIHDTAIFGRAHALTGASLLPALLFHWHAHVYCIISMCGLLQVANFRVRPYVGCTTQKKETHSLLSMVFSDQRLLAWLSQAWKRRRA